MNRNKSLMNTMKSPKTILMILAGIIILFFIYSVFHSFQSFKSSSPYLIRGTMDGSAVKVIPANRIADPSDGKYGQEFTYSCWLYVKDTNFRKTEDELECEISGETNQAVTKRAQNFKMIFNKGSNDFRKGRGQASYPTLSSPGVFLYPDTNKLHIQFNTYDTNQMYKSADVGNIPLNKWFMLTIVLIGNSVDIYINNMLKKREVIGVVKMNYGDLYIGSYGGFDGYLANMRYYNRAIQVWEIDDMYQVGSTTELKQPVNNIQQVADLSKQYYFTTGFPNSTYPVSTST